MIPYCKHFIYTKHIWYLLILAFFILPNSILKSANSGGNDSILSTVKSNISVDKQKNLIRYMTAEQLTTFIDKTFELDTIPFDIVNEINLAVANLKNNENSFKNIVIAQPNSPINIQKIEETNTLASSKELATTKENIPLQIFKMNRVTLIDDNIIIPVKLNSSEKTTQKRTENNTMKTLEMIAVPVKVDNINPITTAELRANENIMPILTAVNTLEINSVSLNIKNTNSAPTAELRANENIMPILTVMNTLEMNTVSLNIENTNSAPTAELRANENIMPILTVMNTLEMNTVSLNIENTNSAPTAELRANENIMPILTVMNTLEMNTVSLNIENTNSAPVAELRANENIMPILTAVNTLEMNPVSLNIENTNSAPTAELRANENIMPMPENNSNQLTRLEDINITESSVKLNTEQSKMRKPTPLDLLKMNLLANNNIVHEKNVTTSPAKLKLDDHTVSLANDPSLPIPSADYYVSWEINKLFPEKDMLQMNGDTSITLVLLSKEHRHYSHPFNGPITSNFGWRDSAQHNGIDIDLNRGDKVAAAFDGMVRVARRYGGFGNVVIIRHYNGLETVYAHLSKIKVKPGQLVSAGNLVGLGGSTGHSTGSHLHFEVRFKGVPINPKYLISLSEQKLMCAEFTLKKTKWGLAAYPTNTKLYTVEKGDTVFEIAKRFGTTTASIKKMNNLNGSRVRLKAGQQINVAH